MCHCYYVRVRNFDFTLLVRIGGVRPGALFLAAGNHIKNDRGDAAEGGSALRSALQKTGKFSMATAEEMKRDGIAGVCLD